ncbi:hypothetical protein ACSUZJ_01625 [Telluria sp. B2]
MYELSLNEIDQVAGGEKKSKEKTPPKSGTLPRPTRGESEAGREFNDLMGMLDALGSWIGISIYDAVHKQQK